MKIIKNIFYKYMESILKIIKNIFYNYIEDILIFLGLIIIVITTLVLNFYVGMYVLAIIFLILGIYFAKNPLRRR